MYELVAVGFKGTHRASEVLNQVQSLNDQWSLFLRDGVSVYRTENGKLHIDQSVEPTSRSGAAWGGLLGGMLGLPTTEWTATPFSESEAIAAAPATADWRAVGEIEHVFTHFALTLTVYEGAGDMDAEWTGDLSVLPSVFLKAARLALTPPAPLAPAPAGHRSARDRGRS